MLAGKPSFRCFRVAVEAGNIRFDVKQRCSVENVDAFNREPVSAALQKSYDSDADAVGAAGMTCGENAVWCVIQKRVADQFTRVGPVEMIKEVEMAEQLYVQQPFSKFGEKFHRADRVRVKGTLDRRLGFAGVVSVNDTDCLYVDYHGCLPSMGADTLQIEERSDSGTGFADKTDFGSL